MKGETGPQGSPGPAGLPGANGLNGDIGTEQSLPAGDFFNVSQILSRHPSLHFCKPLFCIKNFEC